MRDVIFLNLLIIHGINFSETHGNHISNNHLKLIWWPPHDPMDFSFFHFNSFLHLICSSYSSIFQPPGHGKIWIGRMSCSSCIFILHRCMQYIRFWPSKCISSQFCSVSTIFLHVVQQFHQICHQMQMQLLREIIELNSSRISCFSIQSTNKAYGTNCHRLRADWIYLF